LALRAFLFFIFVFSTAPNFRLSPLRPAVILPESRRFYFEFKKIAIFVGFAQKTLANQL
jgi:hypothetical protein